MYFSIGRESVQLHQPSDTSAFSAVCPVALNHDDLAEVLRRERVGNVLPGDTHLMVRVDAVRRLAAGRVEPSWDRDLDGMLAYAASKGWLSEDGASIRAHLVREGQ